MNSDVPFNHLESNSECDGSPHLLPAKDINRDFLISSSKVNEKASSMDPVTVVKSEPEELYEPIVEIQEESEGDAENYSIPLSQYDSDDSLQDSKNEVNNDRKDIETEIKPFKCNECKKAFHLENDLKIHMTIHSEENPVRCKDCNKLFCYTKHKRSPESLCANDSAGNQCSGLQSKKKHIKKSFTCNECHKEISSLAKLREHMRIHSGEKPFHCTQCPRSFARSFSLKVHTRVHTREKPFNCIECLRSFAQLSALKRHMKIHSGEKPFSCSQCPRTFIQSGNLRTHMKKAH